MGFVWKELERADRAKENRSVQAMGWTSLALVVIGVVIMVITHSTKMIVPVIFVAVMGGCYLAVTTPRRRSDKNLRRNTDGSD